MRTAHYALLIALVLTLSACAADDIPAESVPAPPSEETTAPTPPSESDTAADPSPEPEDPAERSTFESLFTMRTSGEWMVRYTFTTRGLPEETIEAQMTQYMSGTDKLRTDVDIGDVESRTYLIDGTVTVCTLIEESWMCFGSDVESDVIAEVESSIEDGSYDLERTRTRTIAGTSASCYAFTTIEGGSGEYCFSAEGVPLFIEAKWDGVSTELLATEYALSVPAGTWDIPESTGLPGGFDPSDWI